MSTYNNQTGRLSPQTLLQHRYLIVGPTGRGGMGAVYEGIDTRLGQRRVAIKEMSQAHLNEEELVAATARFQHEAHMLGSLSHPSLPHIIDAFSENERSYLVMDFIDGKTLYQMLREAQGKPLPLAQVIHYAQQLCSVLAYLHQQNPPIIFRDIKPTNIMITNTNHLFLIDFGIARFFKEGQEHDTMLLGSPGYAAPEQHGSAQTNPRSDIYALGATLHYCLTGQDPYHTNAPFYFAPISQYNPIIPVEVDQLIQRMVAQDERDRPTNILEVQQSIARISQQAGENTMGLTPQTPQTPPTLYAQPTMPAQRPDRAKVDAHAPTVAVNAPQPLTHAATQISAAQPTLSPWKTGFITIVGIILAISLGASAFALSVFNTQYGWALVTESGLTLLLTLITCIGSTQVQSMASRLILLLTALVSLIAGGTFAVAGSVDMQTLLFGSVTSASAYANMFNLLFTASLAIAGILSLYWLLRPFTIAQRILLLILFGLALACILIQISSPLVSISKHQLLLPGLIALVLGALLATQLERVQKRAQVVVKQTV
jgi:serine/threonine protein kinase